MVFTLHVRWNITSKCAYNRTVEPFPFSQVFFLVWTGRAGNHGTICSSHRCNACWVFKSRWLQPKSRGWKGIKGWVGRRRRRGGGGRGGGSSRAAARYITSVKNSSAGKVGSYAGNERAAARTLLCCFHDNPPAPFGIVAPMPISSQHSLFGSFFSIARLSHGSCEWKFNVRLCCPWKRVLFAPEHKSLLCDVIWTFLEYIYYWIDQIKKAGKVLTPWVNRHSLLSTLIRDVSELLISTNTSNTSGTSGVD